MKKKLIRLTAVIAAAVMVMGLVVGCGSTNEKKPSDSTVQNAATEVKTEEAKPVTLNFLFLNEWKDAQGAYIQKQLDEKFYKENPNIKVKMDMLSVTDYQKKILSMTAVSANDYDMYFVDNGWTPNFAATGACADITELAKNIDLKSYNQSFLQTCYVDGKLYALPFETDCRLLAYNKKMFADANIQPPKTTDEFLAAAKALTKDGNYGFIEPFAIPGQLPYSLSMMFYGDGGDLIKDGKAAFNTPEGVKFIDRVKELFKYMPKDAFSYDYAKADAAFAGGKIGMAFYGPWIYGTKAINDAKLDYGLVTIPAGSQTSASTMGGWLIGISGNSKNKEAAMKVLEFFSKPEINASIVGALSPIPAAYAFPPMSEDKYKIFGEQIKTARMVYPAGFQLANDIMQPYFMAFSKAVLTDMSSADGAKYVNDEIQKVLDSKK